MILLNLNDENITEKIDFEISNLEQFRKFFLTQKDILLKYFNITLISMSSDSNYILELNKFLEDFNIIFDKINTSIKNVAILKKKLELIKMSISTSPDKLNELFNSYNETYISDYPMLLECMNFIIDFIEELFVTPQYEKSSETTRNMFSIKEDLKRDISSSKKQIKEEKTEITNTLTFSNTPTLSSTSSTVSAKSYMPNSDLSIFSEKETLTTNAVNKIDEDKNNDNSANNINDSFTQNDEMQNSSDESENEKRITSSNRVTKLPLQDNNSLIISEKDKLVYLPFKVEDLKKEYLDKSKKYTGLIDLINHEYIYPISKYRNTVTSRFKEAYSLMVNKEKSSTLSALELGLEVAFNYSLHPAVISACKSLEELDEYLDALDVKDMSRFQKFKVEFEVLPK